MVATSILQELVPDWLRGTWTRDYIRRAVVDSSVLGPPDSSVHVRYIQTPWAFVDVRRAPGTMVGAMAFAGITTVVLGNNDDDDAADSTPPLVRWHACLDMTDPFEDASERWSLADNGSPRPTEDEGYFTRLSENDVYQETDPAGSLEEQWVRRNDGSNQFLAARRGTALLVVAGDTFGFATQTTEEMSATFCAGHILSTGEEENWVIEISASDPNLEGSVLVLPGKESEWTILCGSTLPLKNVNPRFQT